MSKPSKYHLTPVFQSIVSLPFHVIVAFLATLFVDIQEDRHWYFLFCMFCSFAGTILGGVIINYGSTDKDKK